MNTKLLTKLSIVFLLSINPIQSQTITFEKSFPYINPAGNILQTTDSGFIFSARLNESIPFPYTTIKKLISLKLNKYGFIEWQKEYGSNDDFNSPYIIKITNSAANGFLIVTGEKTIDEWNTLIIKTDELGNELWRQTYGVTGLEEIGQGAIEIENGEIIVLETHESDVILRKIDEYGNQIWEGLYSSNFSFYPPSISNLPDTTFVVRTLHLLHRINDDGATLWTENYSLRSVDLTNDNNLIGCKTGSILKIDFNGNILWENPNVGGNSIAAANDNGFILVKGDTLIKTDSLGYMMWKKPIRNVAQYIHQTSDMGYITAGRYYPWLLKIDSLGNDHAINLTFPYGGQLFNAFNDYDITWFSNGVDHVNIDYSADNGNNWENIITYYPASLESFTWTVPNSPSDSAHIRVSDFYNPEIYDRTDPQFSIQLYQEYDFISINEVKMWIGNNGDGSHDPGTDGNGFYRPGGENATLSSVFEDGLVWGGIVNGQIRVNGNTHRQGIKPGIILPNGLPGDPLDPKYKIFKIRRNWEFLPPSIQRDRYEYDYFNWPWDIGAPWVDIDGDGIYTPGIDIPEYIGDEVLFYTANDLDSVTTAFTYGSPPIGLEFNTITYGLNREDELKDAVFKKYRLINKSSTTIDSMYLTYWTDDDLGDAGDDFVGCDTLLNLGYTYNADEDDGGFYDPPAAVGHLMVQGPITHSTVNDSAYYNNQWIQGYKNLPLTSFVFFVGASIYYRDPNQGMYQGTIEFYNYMNGLVWNGDPYIDPHTGLSTKFCLAGDPIGGTGWYEGDGWPGGFTGGDRRYVMTSGPFTLAPNDTQEVVYSIFMAQGTDRLNSVQLLKEKAEIIKAFYYGDTLTGVDDNYLTTPYQYKLYQNYPNPFNPTTTIEYTIPTKGLVELKVYDVLGREIITLINQEQIQGKHKILFNASNYASGVYFYQLKTSGFIKSRKMVLIK